MPEELKSKLNPYFSPAYKEADKEIFNKTKDKLHNALTNAEKVRNDLTHDFGPSIPIQELNPYTNVDKLIKSLIPNISGLTS